MANARVISVLIFTLLFAGCDALVNSQLNEIESKVADDAENQYRMVVDNGGSAIERCVQAGMVSAAWLQAENQEKYAHSKVLENLDCANAGLPRQ